MSLVISKVFTYDTDAGNYIQAVEGPTGDNQALEPAVRQAINNFVIGCKQDGIWSAIKASCILAGARTLNGALQPLVGTAPTNNNFVSGDYNRKTGLVGNGGSGASTKYLNSKRRHDADSQNDAHVAIYLDTLGQNLGISLGAGASTPANSLTQLVNSSQGDTLINSAGASSGLTVSPSNGFLWGLSRSSSSSFSARINGATYQSGTNASAVPTSYEYAVFARNLNGTVGSHSPSRLGFYSIGSALDLAKLDTRVKDLITAFGAAIP